MKGRNEGGWLDTEHVWKNSLVSKKCLFIYITDLRNALFTSTLFPFESCNIKKNNLIDIVYDQQLNTHMHYAVQSTKLMSCLFAEKYMWLPFLQYNTIFRAVCLRHNLTHMFKKMILLYLAKYMHADFHANVIKLYNYITVSIQVKKYLNRGFCGFFFSMYYIQPKLWIEKTKELVVFVTEFSWYLKGLVAIVIATAVRKKSLAAVAPSVQFSETPPHRERELDRCSRIETPPHSTAVATFTTTTIL